MIVVEVFRDGLWVELAGWKLDHHLGGADLTVRGAHVAAPWRASHDGVIVALCPSDLEREKVIDLK